MPRVISFLAALIVVIGLQATSLVTLAAADESAAPKSPPDVSTFLKLLDDLQGDEAARQNVRKSIQDAIDQLKNPPAAPAVAEAEKALAEAQQNVTALQGRVDALSKELEAAKGEYAQLEQQVSALTKQVEEAKAQPAPAPVGDLAVYERTLQLIDSLAPAAPIETAAATPATPAALTDEQKQFFEKSVRTVLAENCFGCHGPDKQKGELRLDSLASLLKGGKRGPAIKPGDTDASILIQAICQTGDLKMPPEKRLDDASIQVLMQWVKLGAPWPADSVPAAATAAVPTPAAEPVPAAPVAAAPAVARTTDKINFAKEIRPILSNYCFACHGPDDQTRKADLRLDDEASAMAALKSGAHAVVPGDRNSSELYKRITTADADDVMPPADFGKKLNAAQIELLGRWIDAGGKHEAHWAFVAPKEQVVPAVSRPDWGKNPIDAFILARLEQEGLQPSAEADRRTQIRRLSYDLTGLPPTLEDVNRFVNDTSPDAYEKLVEQYFASPHYGEHMARYWLDLARYADTNGYHIDNERYMWRWRDWLIDAYNRNLPFDQFTIDQLAGDLLPSPKQDQIIATGFNRNHMITFEGGVIPEEYRVQYVNDRLTTTSTVWMALTMNCAQCHDHKFDPITMKDFYQFSAFFASIPEQGIDGQKGNSVPVIQAPLPDQEHQLAQFASKIDALVGEMNQPLPEVDAKQAEWEATWLTSLQSRWTNLLPTTMTSAGNAMLTLRPDNAIFVSGENPDKDVYEISATTTARDITAIRFEALTDPALPQGGAGRSDVSNFVMTEFEAEIAPANQPELVQKVKFSVANGDFAQEGLFVGLAIDGNPETGWVAGGDTRRENRTAVFIPERPLGYPDGSILKIRIHFGSKFAKHSAGCFRLSVTSAPDMAPAIYDTWHMSGPYVAKDGAIAYETAFTPEKGVNLEAIDSEGRLVWVPRTDLVEGAEQRLIGNVAATYLYRSITSPSDRQAVFTFGSNDAVKVWVNGQVVLDNNVQRGLQVDQDRVPVSLKAGKNDLLVKVVNYGNAYAYAFRRAEEVVGEIPLDVEPILALAGDKRTPEQTARIRAFYRSKNWPEWAGLDAQLASVRGEQAALAKAVPTTMVMQELPTPRETFMLKRGAYDQQGDKVVAAVPAALPKLPADVQPNRLGLAKWLLSPEHPLTARVAMNRTWQNFFGTGIVKTTEDFGIQGDLPSHQELLDWMSVEFMKSGWDVKHMTRLIVTSQAYRQSAVVTPALLELDPENRLLARGPRFRMDGEMVRDTALTLSGLLVPTIGGPSVKTYQPKGIWEEVSYGGKDFTGQVFEQDHGEKLYRRSMYTFWKRQAPPPAMLLFDAPNREVCTARRARTNTPLQALVTMNDTQFVEAARFLAQRIMKEGGSDAASRIRYGFQLATSREPSEQELAIVQDVYLKQLEEYQKNPESAKQLLAVGESPRDEACDPVDHAAWTLVASMILNLDETLTKG